MSLDVYFKEDIANVIKAAFANSEMQARMIAKALVAQGIDPESVDALMNAYTDGFNAALCSVGLAFGLDMEIPESRGEYAYGIDQPESYQQLPGSYEEEPHDGDLVGYLWEKAQRNKGRY
jgi:hypothetical protein